MQGSDNNIITLFTHAGINLYFESAVFPLSCKSSVIIPLIKKPGLDSEILKNYRPVANLHFLSKVIEKVIVIQIHDHLSKISKHIRQRILLINEPEPELALLIVFSLLIKLATAVKQHF